MMLMMKSMLFDADDIDYWCIVDDETDANGWNLFWHHIDCDDNIEADGGIGHDDDMDVDHDYTV